MKIHKFLPPYKASGKTTFPKSRNRSGVYIIKENGKIVYIGHSRRNLYKTLYRHFQSWTDPTQERVTYVHRLSRHKYTVRIIYTTSAQAPRLERSLILKYRPRDNDEKYKEYKQQPQDKSALRVYEKTKVVTETPF